MDRTLVLRLILAFVTIGFFRCEDTSSTVTVAEVVGVYHLKRNSGGSPDYVDKLQLYPDGTYVQTVQAAGGPVVTSQSGAWALRGTRIELVGWRDFVGFTDGARRGAPITIAPQAILNRQTGSLILLLDSGTNLFYAKLSDHARTAPDQ
jgi:hypothetical protein